MMSVIRPKGAPGQRRRKRLPELPRPRSPRFTAQDGPGCRLGELVGRSKGAGVTDGLAWQRPWSSQPGCSMAPAPV